MLRFLDSFDHYASGDLEEKWTQNSFCALGSGNGRRSTNGMRQSSYNSWLGLDLDNQATWIVGCALRITAYPTGGAAGLLEWQDATNMQGRIRIGTDGTWSYQRGSTPVGSASTATIALNTYTYVEMRITFHDTAGVVQVRLNGTLVLDLSGIDTQQTANASANRIRLGNHGTGGTFTFGTEDIDDVYVCDGTGTVNNTFLGDCRVDVLRPTADGANSAWTPSTGTSHFALVDETTPNDDSDYLSTSTAGVRDTQALGDLPSMTDMVVAGVQQCVSARKDDAGTRQMKGVLKSGGTTQAGSVTHTLTTSYRYYRQITETDPATSAPWTEAGVNALESGVENI